MASAAYDAANNNWSFTQTSATTSNYILFNNTRCGIRVNISSAGTGVGDVDIEMAPGEAQWYRQNVAGTITVTGTPIHTASGALERFADGNHEHEIEEASNVGISDANTARLVLGPF